MKSETKVGIMFLVALVFVAIFAYVLGAFNPFSNAHSLYIAYNFAGGIEEGSPVRVMGIKVGKVQKIDFQPEQKVNGEEVKLRIKVSIDKSAWKTVRQDSNFYINLAGVIGEKFIEVTPGSIEAPPIKVGSTVRGEDPPRVDQLISQSYGLAGKIIEFVEQNEGSVINTIETMNTLVKNLNQALIQFDKLAGRGELNKLIKNLNSLTADASFFTQKMRSEEGQKTLELLKRLLWRLEDLDAKAIRKFLQDEGIKAKLF